MNDELSEAELAAVGKLLAAYKRTLAEDLAHASDGERMFVLITAPTGRPGSAHFVTNMKGAEHGEAMDALLGVCSKLFGEPVLLNTGHMDHD